MALTHPLGNFSISRYAGLQLGQDVIELHYLLDMEEIPTFVEIQESNLVPEVGHPSLRGYLDRQIVLLQEGLLVEVNGQCLPPQGIANERVFPQRVGFGLLLIVAFSVGLTSVLITLSLL